MRFADIGYAVIEDDAISKITWEQFRSHLEEEGKNEYEDYADPSEYPYEIEVEFGDNQLVSTTTSDAFINRVVRLGDTVYGDDGEIKSFNLKSEYYMHYNLIDGEIWGDVLEFGSYMVVAPFTVDADHAYNTYIRENIDSLEVHSFDNSGYSSGIGKTAFTDGEVSGFFEDKWYLNPFGNNLIQGVNEESSSSDSNQSSYLRKDTVITATWSGSVWINREKKGSTSDSVIQAKQVVKGGHASGWVGSIVTGTSQDDIVRGLGGFDQLFGKRGDDLIHGGNGRDIIDGGKGSDELHGDFGWNTYKDQRDGSKDLIAIKSDQYLVNPWDGQAGNNPNGEKADFLEGLDDDDEIKIVGVATENLEFKEGVTARGVTGIGIYAGGSLEAVYTGRSLGLDDITQMTTGETNVQWSYWGDNTVPPLQT